MSVAEVSRPVTAGAGKCFQFENKLLKLAIVAPALVLGSSIMSCASVQSELPADAVAAGTDWGYYNGAPSGTHYSRLRDINTTNVHRLRVAWTYDTQDNITGAVMESNPLAIRGRLYFVSPKGRLICLDGASGKELWTFDPAGGKRVYVPQVKRGVAYWSDGTLRRVLFTFRSDLISVDADSGRLAPEFGEAGRVDLRLALDRDPENISVAFNSPGVVCNNLIVVGSTGSTPGHIRAFDVRNGKLRWIFHTIPYPGEEGYETWPNDAWKTAMGANCWSGFSLDRKRGLVFVPTASAGMNDKDFYGADRLGDNLFAKSLLALDANTGKRVWHFQIVRHDLWDRDLPTPPTLVSVKRHGKSIDAVAQITKSGYVFVLDRATGKPLFPVEERPALSSDIPGETTAVSQVVPLLPEPFARQHVTIDMLTHRTPEAYEAAANTLAEFRSQGPFDPPSLQGTIDLPGIWGGGEWGGAAFDPQTGLLFVNSIEKASILKLKKRPPLTLDTGRAVYLNSCAVCHGEDLKGSSPEFPSLIDIGIRIPLEELTAQIAFGSGRMPGFRQLTTSQFAALLRYLSGTKGDPVLENFSSPTEPYIFESYTKFLDADGYPAISPPWGTLSAIDLNTGHYVWRIPFGEYPELVAQGLKDTGSENYGGAVVTAGGLLFIGATVYDSKFHAFDKRTGKLLWETTLPAAGNATPATYRADGRQFVVISVSGGKTPKAKSESMIVAFALPP
jgi:quinoprotein glucose dehydrogenase